MGTFIILKSGLVLHIAGIATMVGFTLASFVTYRQILKIFPADKEMALKITRATRGFQAFQMLGGFLIVIGGIIMMVAYQGVIMHMVWFKIKMIVLLMIILNAIILGRPATKKLLFILRDPQTEPIASQSSPSAALFNIRRKIVLFYVLQLVFFLLIFILSSFKFN